MQKSLSHYEVSWIGKRSNQEDYGRVLPIPAEDTLLAVIADGMGGHNGGEVASLNAVESFVSSYAQSMHLPTSKRLLHGLESASHSIEQIATNHKELSGLGCTLVAAHINGGRLSWISVGDSHLFHYRNGILKKMNADHSMGPIIAEHVQQGKISVAEAAQHPHRNALRSALMGPTPPLIDLSSESITLNTDDYVILATDGLNTLSFQTLSEIVKKNHRRGAKELTDTILDKVKDNSAVKQDNIHIISIQILNEVGHNHSKIPKARRKYILPLAGVISGAAVAAGYAMYSTDTWQPPTGRDVGVSPPNSHDIGGVVLRGPTTVKSTTLESPGSITLPIPRPDIEVSDNVITKQEIKKDGQSVRAGDKSKDQSSPKKTSEPLLRTSKRKDQPQSSPATKESNSSIPDEQQKQQTPTEDLIMKTVNEREGISGGVAARDGIKADMKERSDPKKLGETP